MVSVSLLTDLRKCVGPVLTINHGITFMVTDLKGEITTESEQGVSASDTRFVSP